MAPLLSHWPIIVMVTSPIRDGYVDAPLRDWATWSMRPHTIPWGWQVIFIEEVTCPFFKEATISTHMTAFGWRRDSQSLSQVSRGILTLPHGLWSRLSGVTRAMNHLLRLMFQQLDVNNPISAIQILSLLHALLCINKYYLYAIRNLLSFLSLTLFCCCWQN